MSQGFALNRDPVQKYRESLAHWGDRVVVGYCVGSGGVERLFEASLRKMRDLDVVAQSGRFGETWCLVQPSSANLSVGRNLLVRRFLSIPEKPAWLLMVDSDMTWDPMALEHLLDWAQPDRIIGGLCFTHGPDGRIVPTIFDQDAESGFAIPWPAGEKVPENTVLPVYATGAAFLLIHRAALQAIGKLTPGPDCWFREHERYVEGQGFVWMSEDFVFCDLAHQAGVDIYVHTGVEIGHVKPVVLNRRLFDVAENDLAWG